MFDSILQRRQGETSRRFVRLHSANGCKETCYVGIYEGDPLAPCSNVLSRGIFFTTWLLPPKPLWPSIQHHMNAPGPLKQQRWILRCILGSRPPRKLHLWVGNPARFQEGTMISHFGACRLKMNHVVQRDVATLKAQKNKNK